MYTISINRVSRSANSNKCKSYIYQMLHNIFVKMITIIKAMILCIIIIKSYSKLKLVRIIKIIYYKSIESIVKTLYYY